MTFKHESALFTDGYAPHKYIGLLQHMFLFCDLCKEYHWHTLVVKTTSDWRYICQECHCADEKGNGE